MIPNFGFVTERHGHKLYRSGQPNLKGYDDAWTQLGVKTVFMLNGDYPIMYPKHEELVYSYHELDPYKPDDDQIAAIIYQIDQALKDGPVLVHCYYGRDRTGSTIGAWRILMEDWDSDRAWKEQESYSENEKIPFHADVLKDFLDGLHYMKRGVTVS